MTEHTDGLNDSEQGEVESVDSPEPDRGVVALVGHRLRYRVTIIGTTNGPQVTELTVIGDGQPITSADLHRIPLARIARAIRDAHPITWEQVDPLVTWETANAATTWETPPAPRRGRPPVTEERIAEVAAYAIALHAQGAQVRERLADRYGVTVRTVDRWLSAARDRGLITDLYRRREAQ
ncbi:hypothetical protein [Rhodococcus globerulus]|uniref:hypothetical protein n=1 Tax=Rhodococcus globerulus TaxID=33008 RepID=UPI0030180581